MEVGPSLFQILKLDVYFSMKDKLVVMFNDLVQSYGLFAARKFL